MKNDVKLRYERSLNCSGKLFLETRIPLLKTKHYIIKDYDLDGDAPKQFIKAYFFEKDSNIKKHNPKTWNSYVAKTAEKWYPHESVIEYMINRIGQVLGVYLNDIYLIKANDQIRFLSKYFLKKGENLVHGAEICGEHLGDMLLAKEIADHKKTSRELFTFEFIKDAIRSVFPKCFEQITEELVKMIVFDAIVGNNDRHFYNWGVIANNKRMLKLPSFAPIYDSARGLLWNRSDENIIKLLSIHNDGGKKVLKYINNASPRISIESNTLANHFELIDFIGRINDAYLQLIKDLSSVDNERNVLDMLRKEFFPFFIPERSKLIIIILKTRFEKIRGI